MDSEEVHNIIQDNLAKVQDGIKDEIGSSMNMYEGRIAQQDQEINELKAKCQSLLDLINNNRALTQSEIITLSDEFFNLVEGLEPLPKLALWLRRECWK